MTSLFFSVIGFLFFPLLAEGQANVRLVDGPNPNEGRVEIFKGGVWLSVCRSHVSSEFGKVVCGQLSYKANGAVMYYANAYGSAPGEILKENINCNGHISLLKCIFTPKEQNCNPLETLGLSCDTGLSVSQPVRLVNGTSPYEGRVEVFKSGVWGTVTDIYFYSGRPLYNAIAANIVCRELFGPSYGGSALLRGETALRFGVARNRAIQMINVRCDGNEQLLHNCSYESPWQFDSHENSLGVVCKQVPIGCNGYISSSSGTIQSPGYPEGLEYRNDTDCVWKIVNKDGKIRLTFKNLHVNNSLNPRSNNIQVFNSNTASIATIQSPTTLGALLSSGNELYIWLKAQASTKGIQFQASWDIPPCFERFHSTSGFIKSPSSQYQPNLNCTYEIVKRKGVWVNFKSDSFALRKQEKGVCPDYIQIFDGNSELSPRVKGPVCGTALPVTLRTFNLNSSTVLVRVKTDGASTPLVYTINYYTEDPDPISLGNYTEDRGSFQSPGYPDVYNGEEDCIWTITTKPYMTITLFFHDMQIGPCCDNKLQVEERWLLRKYFISGSGSVVSDSNSLRIILSSALGNNINKFNASWTTVCRQVFDFLTGIIISPVDPDFNSSSANCSYIIRQMPGYFISLQFSTFSFEKDQSCRNFIQIHDGSSDFFPVLGEKNCGRSLPPPLNSTQNVVFMNFRSQTGYNNFSLVYTSHPKLCDKPLMTDREGSFTSPGFPLGYPSNTYCVWTIKADDNESVIELSFDDFSVGSQGTPCPRALVKVYDGPVVDANTVIATLCGTSFRSKLRSTGNSMTVVLNVFGSVMAAEGFRASYIARNLTGGLPKGLYPYGIIEKDVKLRTSQYEIPMEDGFPFGESIKASVNVGANGVLTFDEGTAWPRLDSSRHMLCVYCTHINSHQDVYYHLYQDSIRDRAVLDKASNEVQDFTGSNTFNASTVLIVTWDRVEQYFPSIDYKPTNMGEATFQVALVTNGTESYALVQYRVGHMTWRYPGRGYIIEMGVAKGSLTTFRANGFSGTEFAYEVDKHFGNTGVPAPDAVFLEPWSTSGGSTGETSRTTWSGYILNVARTWMFQPFGKECCYSTNPQKADTVDMLVTSPPFAGASLAFNPLMFGQGKLYDAEDRLPHFACCKNTKQCKKFYDMRRSEHCDPNPVGQWSSMYGDPHITTLDERQYILNGVGEFTLVSLTTANVSFTLQARTERAELRVGVSTNGSVFTAIGAEENGARVFVQVDPNTNTTLVVYAKGIDYTSQFMQEGDNFVVDDESVMLIRDNDTCVVTFPSGISLRLYIRMKALIIGISMPRDFRGFTIGLLGNFNGDQTDDFVLPSGECLNNSLSERQILNFFASKWRVTTNNTVMRYEPRMGPADYNRLDFVPLFLDEVESSKLTKAKVLCGDTNLPCIYDFLATGDRNFASQTADLRNISDILIQQSKNTAPVVEVSEVLQLTLGVPMTLAVTGVDPDATDRLTHGLRH